MTHWGWYWKIKREHTPKALCNWYTCLDSFQLFKDKNLSGFTLKNEKFTLVAKLDGDKFIVTVRDLQYFIPVEKQSCHFGGHRYFVRCPIKTCNRRMRKLYCYGGFYLCRKCLKLGYLTQRFAPSVRLGHMKNRIEKSLEKAGGSLWDKPKGMHRKTYEKLRDRYWDYEWKCEEAIIDEIRKMYGVEL